MNLQRRIIIITAVFPPEPVVSANISYDIASELSKDCDITVLSPQPTRPYGYIFNDQERVTQFKHIVVDSYTCPKSQLFGRLRESYEYGRKCAAYIDNYANRIDVVYMNTWPLLGQFYVAKACIKNRIPYLIHIQDVYPESLLNKYPFLSTFIKFPLLLLDKYVLRKASSIITISNHMQAYLCATRKLSPAKIFVINNWQNIAKFTQHTSQNIHNDVFTFLFLGSISRSANLDTIIKAFYIANICSAKLIIAGSGAIKNQLMEQTAKMGCKSIEFIEAPATKIAEIQSSADVLVLSIEKNGARFALPSKLPAYMFSKKPILACVDADSATSDVVCTSNCGLVTSPDNIDQIASSMQHLFASKEMHQIWGLNGYNYASQRFSRDLNLYKITVLIKECK